MKVYTFRMQAFPFHFSVGEVFMVTKVRTDIGGIVELELRSFDNRMDYYGYVDLISEPEETKDPKRVVELGVPSKLSPEARRKLEALPKDER